VRERGARGTRGAGLCATPRRPRGCDGGARAPFRNAGGDIAAPAVAPRPNSYPLLGAGPAAAGKGCLARPRRPRPPPPRPKRPNSALACTAVSLSTRALTPAGRPGTTSSQPPPAAALAAGACGVGGERGLQRGPLARSAYGSSAATFSCIRGHIGTFQALSTSPSPRARARAPTKRPFTSSATAPATASANIAKNSTTDHLSLGAGGPIFEAARGLRGQPTGTNRQDPWVFEINSYAW
jgi:hypothetical protein